MKKRVLLALIVALVVFGAVYASAASLDVFGGFIQAGGDLDLRCDTDGVKVGGWGLETDDNSVRSVRLTGVNGAACVGSELFIKVHRTGAPPIQMKTTLTTASDYTFKFTAPYPTPAEIVGIDVFIEGAE